MIQRIQSIWLLLAALAVLCLLFFPMAGSVTAQGYYLLTATGLKLKDAADASIQTHSSINIALLIFTGVIVAIHLINIFNFRNRALQIRMVWTGILLIIALSVWFFMLMKGIGEMKELDIEAPILLPLLAIIFDLFALRGIKRDEKLIRSADRLR